MPSTELFLCIVAVVIEISKMHSFVLPIKSLVSLGPFFGKKLA
jgi:hypothetical protein